MKLVNRFKIGADPEFVFIRPDTSEVIPAAKLGMKVGCAFGEDLGGRSAELRPAPSRSVVKVVASLLNTFRWMTVWEPRTLNYVWRAGACPEGEPIGGHVHLARQQKEKRVGYTSSLDCLVQYMTKEGMLGATSDSRRRADCGYGNLGDVRDQKYGFEYRTLPSWLGSVEEAFFSLTLAKLAAVGLDPNRKPSVKDILDYYAPLDEDAEIAKGWVEKWGIPRSMGGDFKQRWVGEYRIVVEQIPSWFPSSIEPSKDEVEEIRSYLGSKKPIGSLNPSVTWENPYFGEEYSWAIREINTVGIKGLGEICRGLAVSTLYPVYFSADRGEREGFISRGLDLDCGGGIGKKLGMKVKPDMDWRHEIHLSDEMRQERNWERTIQTLTTGDLPIWKCDEVRKGLVEEWKRKVKDRMEKREGERRMIYEI